MVLRYSTSHFKNVKTTERSEISISFASLRSARFLSQYCNDLATEPLFLIIYFYTSLKISIPLLRQLFIQPARLKLH